MEYALNGATTMPLGQQDEIRLAAAAGFQKIEFRAPKMESFLETGTLEQLARLLHEHHIRPLSINGIERFNTAEKERELLRETEKLAGWAAALDCPYLVFVPGREPDQNLRKRGAARTLDRLSCLSEVCARFQIRPALEFLGFPDSTLGTLAEAWRIVERLGREDVGLVLDTFHFFLSGESVSNLAVIPPGRIVIFHVNDVEDLPGCELSDENRVLPGQGIAPLRRIWKVMRERQGIDHASIELFRPQLWREPAEEVLRNCIQSMRSIFC